MFSQLSKLVVCGWLCILWSCIDPDKKVNLSEAPLYDTAPMTQIAGPHGQVKILGDIKYYVNEDTLFVSEKFHTLMIGYNWNDSGDIAYEYTLFFNLKQERNENGWYYLTLLNKGIPRVPGTILSSIVLRNYIGPLIEEKSGVYWANTVLYNIRKDMFVGQDKNIISPELHKLLPYFK